MAKDIDSIFFDITPEIEELALKCETNNAIDKELLTAYYMGTKNEVKPADSAEIPLRVYFSSIIIKTLSC